MPRWRTARSGWYVAEIGGPHRGGDGHQAVPVLVLDHWSSDTRLEEAWRAVKTWGRQSPFCSPLDAPGFYCSSIADLRRSRRWRTGLPLTEHPRCIALVDAPGNLWIGFFLTGGEAHDLFGADLLPTMEIDTLIADEAFGADARVFELLAAVRSRRLACLTELLELNTCPTFPAQLKAEIYAWRMIGKTTMHRTGAG